MRKATSSKTATEQAPSIDDSFLQGEAPTKAPVADILDKQRKEKDVKSFQPFTFGSGSSYGNTFQKLSQDTPGFLKPLDNKTKIQKSAEPI